MTGLAPIDVSVSKMNLRVELLLREAKTTLKPPHTLRKDQWPPHYDEVLVWRRARLARFETNPESLENAKRFYAENCVAFINHWCDTFDPRNANTNKTVWMPFILFAKQEELVQFVLSCITDNQPGLVEKCRTMGATWVCVAISVWLWLFHPGTAIGWGSQKADSVGVVGDPSSIFEKIRMLIRRLPSAFLPEGLGNLEMKDRNNLKAMEIINPSNGATIIGQVGDNIGRGGRTRVFFKDESSHYEHPELIEASLSENTRVPIDISSVNGVGNLFHRKRESGIDWHLGAEIPPGYTRVFVMDWRDHPEYDQHWYDEKKKYHERQATLHVFAQEIERNYAASVQGTIIPLEWLEKCIDAHLKLKIPFGPKLSALDIGDSEDGDRNAQSIREGIVLTYADEWVARDPGVTARKAMGICIERTVPELQYDAAGGLGSNVKSEVNRLKDEGAMPKRLRVVPWNAGGKVLNPLDRAIAADKESPRNKDFFTNLKAQAWWHLRQVIYNTYVLIVALEQGQALEELEFNADELFSIDSKLPLLYKILKELCQATASKGSKLKLLVDKAPDGTRSPNIADSIVMAYWPMPQHFAGEFAQIGLGAKIFMGGQAITSLPRGSI